MVLNLITLPAKPIELEDPHSIVYAHCTLKGLQAGILLGSLTGTIVNLYKMYNKKTEKQFNWHRVGRYARNCVLPMVLYINKMCYDRLSSSVLQKNQSRAWRICKNDGQNLSDDLSIAGICGGLIYGAAVGQRSASQLFLTASLGGLVGLLIDFGIVAGKEISKRH